MTDQKQDRKRSVQEVLNSVCSELNVPKGRENKFANYSYRHCEDINAALKPICEKHRCGYTVDDDIQVVDADEGSNRVYVVACATFFTDDPDEGKITCKAFAREEENKKGTDPAQITGLASSYARKYALCGLFRIDNGLDPDDPHEKTEKVQKKRSLASPDDVQKLATLAAELAELKEVDVKKVLDSLPEMEQLKKMGVRKGQREFYADQCATAIGIVSHWIDQVKSQGVDNG